MLSSLLNSYAWLLDHWWYFHIFAVASALIWVLFGTGSFRRAAKFFIYTSLFSATIVMVSTFFPFIGGKDYFFRVSIELALIFYLLWWIFEAKAGEASREIKDVAKKPLFLAVSMFVLVFLLASLFALDPQAGFWSNYERGEGGVQMLHYYAFFALLVLLFRTERDWRRLFWAAIVAAALMVLYGIVANFGLAENFIGYYQGSLTFSSYSFWRKLTEARFQGSLGNPAYVSPYLLFAMFYAAYLWLGSKLAPARKNLLYGPLILFFLLFFFLGQTRATFIGLGLGAVAFFAYLIFSLPRFHKWLIPGLAALLMLGGLGLYFKDSQFVKSLPGGRVFNISFKTQELNTRLWTWGSAWRGFLERPILGWGPENFSAVFDKHFDPRHHVSGKNTETWFDRAHSAYFDYLAETGILGLAAYIGVFATFLWGLFRKKSGEQMKNPAATFDASKSRNIELRTNLEKAFIFGLLVAYIVQNIAIFEVLPMYINFFFLMAFGYYYFYYKNQHQSAQKATVIASVAKQSDGRGRRPERSEGSLQFVHDTRDSLQSSE